MDFTYAINRFMVKNKTEPGLSEAGTEVSQARQELHECNLSMALLINEAIMKRKSTAYQGALQYLNCRLAMAEREAEELRQIRQHLHELEAKNYIPPESMESVKSEYLNSKNDIKRRTANAYNPLSGIDTNTASPALSNSSLPKSPLDPERSGFLYKRSSHAFHPIWGRRYFTLKGDKLIYHSLGGKVNSC